MGILASNKELSTSEIDCGGLFQIKLSLTAAPDIQSSPTDIVLILDRSGSMAGSPFANLKSGAKKFIDIISESTGGEADGQIGYGSRIGIVSFANTATQNTQLITSVADLKFAVDSLSAGGSTNHEDAFQKALDLFDPNSPSNKVMVMFTDGRTTAGGSPIPVTDAAKAQGVSIYCIGLSGNGGLDEPALIEWASSPASTYVAITPNDEELEKIFEDLAKNIVKPGATEIKIKETVNPCFQIVSITAPQTGTAMLLNADSLEWKIAQLGVSHTETAELEFTVQHIGSCTGTIEVNESIAYSDNENNKVVFPSPKIKIDCGTIVTPEECPVPVTVCFDGCEDSVEFDAGEIALQSPGRLLRLDVTLRNVCPGKRVALAVILTEDCACGRELPRGIKTLTVPAHHQSGCRNVTVRCINFVLPEDSDKSCCQTSFCRQRKIKAKFIAHYIDTDFSCCPKVT